MAIYQFLEFTFCDQSYQLRHTGKTINIRPKTAQAIELFINNPQTLITKDELHTALWGNSQHQDYRLFQVISEIRKLAPNKNLIRTQPNHGYYWLAPTTTLAAKTSNSMTHYAIAASLAICSLAITTLIIKNNDTIEPEIQTALNSYTHAVNAYQLKDYETAQKWLHFSLQENPHSQEAKLLLAEIKLNQQQIAHAQQLAHELIIENESQSYYRGQALSLLSRIAMMQNNFNDALDFAIQGKESVEQGFATCSAQMFEQQIATIVKQQQGEALAVTTRIENQDLKTKSDNLENPQKNNEHAQLCNELKDSVTSKVECKNSEYIAQLFRSRRFIT